MFCCHSELNIYPCQIFQPFSWNALCLSGCQSSIYYQVTISHFRAKNLTLFAYCIPQVCVYISWWHKTLIGSHIKEAISFEVTYISEQGGKKCAAHFLRQNSAAFVLWCPPGTSLEGGAGGADVLEGRLFWRMDTGQGAAKEICFNISTLQTCDY